MNTAHDRPRQARPARPIGVRVPVRLPEELVAEIDRRARILGRSRASIIRSLLLEALGDSAVPDGGWIGPRSVARSPSCQASGSST